jgi:hypothetical protein
MFVALSPSVVISNIVVPHFGSVSKLFDDIYLVDKSAGSLEFSPELTREDR